MDQRSYFQCERQDILSYVPKSGSRMIDIGCGEGAFAELVKKNNGFKEVWGMELDEKSAAVASTRLDRVVKGDIVETLKELPDNYFDFACMNDILEHLVWPELFLKELRTKLTANATIFCSVPNIRYYRLIWNLLQHGDFEYQDSGILDRTHLRFFTKKSFLSVLARTGYEPVQVIIPTKSQSFRFKILNLLTLMRGHDMQSTHLYILAKKT